MAIIIKPYKSNYVGYALGIWNEVVREGNAFPQEEEFDVDGGDAFFEAQTFTGLAFDTEINTFAAVYILHPNNVGRCGHICNASYAVRSDLRGRHIGEAVVKDCIARAKEFGFRILQFNAVVASNTRARHLYKRLGFKELGKIPGGFRMPDGSYAAIVPQFIDLISS